jgi:hypothetical protein
MEQRHTLTAVNLIQGAGGQAASENRIKGLGACGNRDDSV